MTALMTAAAAGSDPATAGSDPARLAETHIPLVAHLVREVSGRIPARVDRNDLRSAGLVALMAAARSFDPDKGVPFAAYAKTRIRGALLDELRSVDWASRSVRRRAREIDAARQRLATAMGQFPDDGLVAETLGLSREDVVRADADVTRASVLSLHGTDQDLGDSLPDATAGPEALIERAERLEYVADAVAELPERLRAVVRGYFIEERPMAELAAELGVTESRISQLRAEALVLLRTALADAFEPSVGADVAPVSGVVARRRAAYTSAVMARNQARRRTAVVRPA